MTRVLSCGAVIYRKVGGRILFLLLKHTNGNHWSLAKGHTEVGESEVQTATREISEETGLRVKFKPGFREAIRYSPSPGVEKTVVLFLAKSHGKKLRLQKSEISNGVWVELEDSLKLISHKDTAEVLRRAYQFLIED